METFKKETAIVIFVVLGGITIAVIAFFIGRGMGNNFLPLRNGQTRNENTPTGVAPTATLPATVVITETAMVSPTAVTTVSDADQLCQAVRTKTGMSPADFQCSVGEIQATVARGSVRNSNEMSGAAWFAGKTAGVWKIAYIGQGVPYCVELGSYPFPKTWLSHCVNQSGQIVSR